MDSLQLKMFPFFMQISIFFSAKGVPPPPPPLPTHLAENHFAKKP